jgi:hypothetical protein
VIAEVFKAIGSIEAVPNDDLVFWRSKLSLGRFSSGIWLSRGNAGIVDLFTAGRRLL